MRYQTLRKWRVPIAAAIMIPVAVVVIANLSEVDAPQATSASPPVEPAPQTFSQPEQKTTAEPGSAPTRPSRRGKDTLLRLVRQGDAKATTVLSYKLRMSDPSTSFIYAVLAAQQSSKAGPLALYLERGSLGYNFKEHRVVNPDQALRAYQAFVIAEKLGYSYPRPRTASRFRALLRRSGMPDQFLDDARERGLVLLNANGEA